MKLRFVRFCFSSVLGFAVDNIVFALLMLALAETGMWRRNAIFISIVVARSMSSFVNFICNRMLVFRSSADSRTAIVRYYLLVLAIMLASYLLTSVISSLLDVKGIEVTVVKIVVETLLFIVSFRMQRDWVYRPSRGTGRVS